MPEIPGSVNPVLAPRQPASRATPAGTSGAVRGCSLSAALSRWIDLRSDGSIRLQLRLESFNVTNTPEFSNPNTSYTANTFSYVTGTLGSGTGVNGTGGGRAVQLGAKITF